MKAMNNKGDVTGYGQSDYQRQIYNEDALLGAFFRARKNTNWKYSVQYFEHNLAIEIAKLAQDLQTGEYRIKPNASFKLRERGKERWISGEHITDRVVKHALCDDVLLPKVEPKLIYDSSAGIPGRGVSFTRKRLVAMLQKYYRKHGNQGYVLLMDYSKYYDNVRHDILLRQLETLDLDPISLDLIKQSLKRDEVDVSYMSDGEYSHCMDLVFDSLAYQQAHHPQTGEKMMQKHLNIGDQLSQIAGMAYPNQIDQWAKTVMGVKYYLRYCDDSLVIHRDKAYLRQLYERIKAQSERLGLKLNDKKSRIVKLSTPWRFLQLTYMLTDNGKVVRKINPKNITRMRRKLKKLVWILPEKEFDDCYRSWFRAYYKYMSKQQRSNMDALFKSLKETRYGI